MVFVVSPLNKHTSLRRKSKDCGAQNQDKMSRWDDMSTRGLLFQWASNITIQLSVLVYYKADLIIISLKNNLFSPWYSWKSAELVLNNNHSLNEISTFLVFYEYYLTNFLFVCFPPPYCNGPQFQKYYRFSLSLEIHDELFTQKGRVSWVNRLKKTLLFQFISIKFKGH